MTSVDDASLLRELVQLRSKLEAQKSALKHWRDQSDLDAAKLKRYGQMADTIFDAIQRLMSKIGLETSDPRIRSFVRLAYDEIVAALDEVI